jgi:outer membrane protein OmpA-like peptidoglycan-associated protein
MIQFDFGKDTIKPESGRILDDIAAILKAHPEIEKVRVEGHTDSIGPAAYNQGLSERRARAVVNALVASDTTTGVNNRRVIGLPHDRLREVLRRYNRLVNPAS